MLELPEAVVISKQINEILKGKTIVNAIANSSPHKFAFYNGSSEEYANLLKGKKFVEAYSYGGMVEINFDGVCVVFTDGANIRYFSHIKSIPAKHQMLIVFDDNSFISASIQMYGGVWCFKKGTFENKYYLGAQTKISPLSDAFDYQYFGSMINDTTVQNLSVKAFLATEQRIPGLGNGVLQDILWNVYINPKTKIKELSDEQRKALYHSVVSTLKSMCDQGGRDTENNLFGKPGGYHTILCSKTSSLFCPRCYSPISKVAYLGGSVYFCSQCQKEVKK